MNAYRFRTALLVILMACGLFNSAPASAAYTPLARASTASQITSNPGQPTYIRPCDWANTYIVLVEVNSREWAVYDEPIGCPARFLGDCFGTFQRCSLGLSPWLGYVVPSKPRLLVPIEEAVADFANGPKDFKLEGKLDTEGLDALAVSVDVKTNTTYVSVSKPGGGGGAVLVYAGGSSTPTATLSVQGASAGAGVAVDSKGNVFWSFDDSDGSGHVAEFVAGKNANPLMLSLSGYDGAAGDIKIDNRDDIVVASPNQSLVAVYPYGGGSPVVSFPVPGTPTSIALDYTNQHLYVADTSHNLIDQFEYPSGKFISSNPPAPIKGVEPILTSLTAPDQKKP